MAALPIPSIPTVQGPGAINIPQVGQQAVGGLQPLQGSNYNNTGFLLGTQDPNLGTAIASQNQATGQLNSQLAQNAGQLANTYQSQVGQGALNAQTIAGQLANTLQQQYGSLANTGLAGQYGLQNVIQQGQNTLTANAQQDPFLAQEQTQALQNSANIAGLQANAGITEANIAAQPADVQAAIALDRYKTLLPYQTQILGQISPLLSNLGGLLGGGGTGGSSLMPNYVSGTGGAGGGGNFSIPQQGGGAVNVPMQTIAPGQAQALMNSTAAQGQAGAQNQVNNLMQGNPALNQQLTQQLGAQNQAGLANATTSFLGALAPANANQALGSAQLQELIRSNQMNQGLGQTQLGSTRLADILSGYGNILGGAAAMGGS